MWRIISGLWMGWGLGSNDAANLFGPGVSAKVIKFRTATILIAIFVIIGSVMEGPKCMQTLGKLSSAGSVNEAFVILFSAALCVMIMSLVGIPVSTSQAVVGAILGGSLFRYYRGEAEALKAFGQLGKIMLCWVGTPIGSAIVAFVLFYVLDKFISKYIKNIIALNKFISWSLIISGCYGAYGLGANNVANTTGIYVSAGMLTEYHAALYGGIAIAVGALTFSRRVMMTVGEKIAVIGPLGALIATFSHSLTIHFFTQIGVPVSSSQAIVGAVMGIGFVKGTGGVSYRKLAEIVVGWILTPLSAMLFSFGVIWVFFKMGMTIL
ncbi:MAG: inorganic phosphate transporter [Candidatus Muiribacterium halophilum]|uniref:Inorganic phosphate transporter n=1 Tax=Muiribacterium halophilum TaxID=2053465 RepID=A0A2N5Z994_MUIH1|nr:MAG: inorganic phosphate transporter [Candidatus Muirbacterium halophilum]